MTFAGVHVGQARGAERPIAQWVIGLMDTASSKKAPCLASKAFRPRRSSYVRNFRIGAYLRCLLPRHLHQDRPYAD